MSTISENNQPTLYGSISTMLTQQQHSIFGGENNNDLDHLEPPKFDRLLSESLLKGEDEHHQEVDALALNRNNPNLHSHAPLAPLALERLDSTTFKQQFESRSEGGDNNEQESAGLYKTPNVFVMDVDRRMSGSSGRDSQKDLYRSSMMASNDYAAAGGCKDRRNKKSAFHAPTVRPAFK